MKNSIKCCVITFCLLFCIVSEHASSQNLVSLYSKSLKDWKAGDKAATFVAGSRKIIVHVKNAPLWYDGAVLKTNLILKKVIGLHHYSGIFADFDFG